MIHWVVVRSCHDIWSCSIPLSLSLLPFSIWIIFFLSPSLNQVLMRRWSSNNFWLWEHNLQTMETHHSSLSSFLQAVLSFSSCPSFQCPLSQYSLILLIPFTRIQWEVKIFSPRCVHENMTIRLRRWTRKKENVTHVRNCTLDLLLLVKSFSDILHFNLSTGRSSSSTRFRIPLLFLTQTIQSLSTCS